MPWCVGIFGGIFVLYGLMSLFSGKSLSPRRLFSKGRPEDDLIGRKARVAGAIYSLVGVIIVAGSIYLMKF